MFRNIASLKVSINGKDHLYLVENETTTEEVKEFAIQLIKYASDIEAAHKAQEEAKLAEAKEPEVICDIEEIKQE